MECQKLFIIALLVVAPIMAEMLRSTNGPSSSAHPYKEGIIFISPRQHVKPSIEPNDTRDLQAYGDIPQKQYSTKMSNIQLPLSPTEKDLNDFKNLFFRTVTSKNGNQVLEPLKAYVKSTQEPLIQNALYSTLNSEQGTAPKNLFNPGASKSDANTKKDMQYSQKYQLIPYEFDTQGGILKEGPAILNSAFEIIIAPQKESVHQRQKDYYHIDNYFDFETVVKEREEARKKAEIIAQSPPVLVQSDINISRKIPVDIIKTVQVPIASPYLVPILERYPVPQPYAVPVEIIRPFAVPLVKTEKIEVERPEPVEIEKHVPSPVEKKVFVKVERPYPVDKIVPVEVKREVPYEVPVYNLARYSIVKHIWDN